MSTEVLVTGTFNILHPGHIRLLEFASRYGLVTVGINADPYLKKKYGDHALPLVDRTYVLNSIKHVDSVIAFMEEDPSSLVKRLKPKIYIKGPDYSGVELPEENACKQVGAHIIIQPAAKEYNSGELVTGLPDSIFNKLNKYS